MLIIPSYAFHEITKDFHVATVWLLCGYCVATVWLLCGCCVAAVWRLCGYYVATVWLLCVCWRQMRRHGVGMM